MTSQSLHQPYVTLDPNHAPNNIYEL